MDAKSHHFIAKTQNEFNCSNKTLPKDHCIVLCNLGKNRSFVVQDAMQGPHWTNDQATLHPVVLYHRNENIPGANPYGVFPAQAQLYAAAAAQGPPPTYDQSLTHQVVGQQVYPPTTGASVYAAQNYQAAAAAAAAAAQGYPLGYPVYSPMQAYYPSLTYSYPGMQPAPLRSTVMIPNGFDAGARFDGIAQPVMPPPPPGVAANAAQLAAMAGHNVALTQKKGSFLTGGSDGGYTFW